MIDKMRYEGERIGARVKVKGLRPVPEESWGIEGTVTRRFGHPDYAAYDVAFDDGGYGLFWHYQLEWNEPPPT